MLIAQRHGVELQYQRVDVTKVQALSDAFEVALVQARYPLRGVVTCAGVTQALPAIEYPVSEFRRIMDVNITGTFLTAQLAARVFLKQGLSGSIVMIASMSGSIANKVSLPAVRWKSLTGDTRVSHAWHIIHPRPQCIKCVDPWQPS